MSTYAPTNTPEPEHEESFTVKEAARMLCLTERHMRKLCAEGKVPAWRAWDGGNWRIWASDVHRRRLPQRS